MYKEVEAFFTLCGSPAAKESTHEIHLPTNVQRT